MRTVTRNYLGLCVVSLLATSYLIYKSSISYYRRYYGRSYIYNSTGYPPLQWPLSLDTVQLTFENTVHYGFDSELADAEWNSTLPSGGAVLHLGPNFRPYTLGMLHEIRCLDIIRKALINYYADESTNPEINGLKTVHHCMNYLRQMVLCRADLHLEWVRAERGNHVTVWELTHTCKDWTAIYDAAESNYASYQSYLKV